MTFAETMGLISDRFGRRVSVTVSGRGERGPATAMTVVGTLGPGLNEQQLAASHHNIPDETIHAFGFTETPDVRVWFAPQEFRDAEVHGDRITVQVGDDVEITFEPPLAV